MWRQERKEDVDAVLATLYLEEFPFSVPWNPLWTVPCWVKSAWNVIILFVVQNWILSDSDQQPETEFHNEPRKQELRKNDIQRKPETKSWPQRGEILGFHIDETRTAWRTRGLTGPISSLGRGEKGTNKLFS